MINYEIMDIIRAECNAIGWYDPEELEGRIYLVLQDHPSISEVEYRKALKLIDENICKYEDNTPCDAFPKMCDKCVMDIGFAALFKEA